jgi:cell division protein FtsI/penicillin-binding protein 2
MQPTITGTNSHLFRIKFWYGIILLIMAVFLVRAFYLQVIKHEFYKNSALTGQYKEYQIPPKRGNIEVKNGEATVPIVLNEVKYTLFADPVYVAEKRETAEKVQQIIGGKIEDIENQLNQNTRYVVLAKKLDKSKKEQLESLEIFGIGLREQSYRTYPQGKMAASLLGFVNDDGEGKYGIEQYMNDILAGKPGQLKAITDAKGVPLVSNKDNVIEEPEDGSRVVLTVDMSMQQQLEKILKSGLKKAISKSGSVVVMDPDDGSIKAMASYPTYNPSEFFNVKDASVFNNTNVSDPYEVGSVMKPLTLAAALDSGAVKKNTSYYDKGYFEIDNAKIENVEEVSGAGTRTMADILRMSLNTGATWLLMQMGDGEINEKARVTWHDYMVNKYQFSKVTGIEQGYESGGSVPDPKEGFGLGIQYANTAFGQGVTLTPVQMASAISSVINGGTYYKPRLVEKILKADGSEELNKPEVVKSGVVNSTTSNIIKEFMINVVNSNYYVYGYNLRPKYSVGGKSGTAQIPNPTGGYYEDKFNGSFMGFVGGDKPEYVIFVRVNEPKIYGYAGSKAAGPIFSTTAEMLIDNFNVLPKTN